ncbi:alcohol dehydrogenase [Mycena crocata]|nr:alcohol dehydrogenase [Mycena crocata]
MAATTIPKTHQVFRRTVGALPLTIEKTTEKVPAFGSNEVLIRIHAVSLNFRDVGMLDGRYPFPVQEGGIPTSDCAAEVFGFVIGERVAPTIMLNNLTGEEDLAAVGLRALGGDERGVLCEYAVFEGKYLVRLPKNLSWEEASTITCAGLTAWLALNMPASASLDNQSALLQGTGGVSLFALLICLAAGIHPIITSSDDEKLGDIHQHKTHPDWATEAKRLTGGKGVDIVVNNIGPSALAQDVDALAHRGRISLVGFLAGFEVDPPAMALAGLMGKNATIAGLAVGPKIDFQNLDRFLEEKDVKLAPLIGNVFSFDDSKAAFEHLRSGKATGRVVIKL